MGCRTYAFDVKPHVTYCDWNEDELDVLLHYGLADTIHTSKYHRTLKQPGRVTIICSKTQHFSVHAVLLSTFSTKFSALLTSNPGLQDIYIHAPLSVSSEPAWRTFTTWLYTFDKVPLPDCTPTRDPSWTSTAIKTAFLLSSFLGAAKFEKYLFRIVLKELHDGSFPKRHLRQLGRCMPEDTGVYRFAKAYFNWEEAGWRKELDPFRWRVEHWYFGCGREGGNWGCFHGMGGEGWRGIWEKEGRGDREMARLTRVDEREEWNRHRGERRAGAKESPMKV